MAKWFKDNGAQNDVVLSTRIRLARNLRSIPFPNKMTPDDAMKVIGLVETALDEMNYTFTKLDIPSMTTAEKHKLVEERYISPNLANSSLPCVAYISEDENVSIMVNEEDHIRLQCIFAGKEDKKAYELITKLDDYLSERIGYAMHEKYGHLTSCLTNVGTGMRVSYMLHLPAIVMSGAAESVFDAVTKLGVTVRGIYGEGTKSSGNLFQFSNQTTLGRTENEIIGTLNETIDSIISKENELKTKLFEKKGLVLEDKIMRSYSILKSARIMQSKEMMERLSDLRFGIGLGIVDDIEYKTLNEIMIQASPSNITADHSITNAFERDAKRAEIIRGKL